MTNACLLLPDRGTLWLPILFTVLMLISFAVDVATGYQFRLSDLYCIVALLMSRLGGIAAAEAIASGGFLLTLASVADAHGLTAAALVHAAVSLALLGAVAIRSARSRKL